MVSRFVLPIALLVALSSCSKREPSNSPRDRELKSFDVAESPGPPQISPTAAPGVAFTYGYDFQLGDDRISGVQEAHATRCEAMGVARCRITGLRYSLTDDERITAMLQVKLAPDIARQFGKDATGDVVKADGQLIRTEFEGEDTAPVTQSAQRSSTDADARIAELTRQLTDPRLKSPERATLREELNRLREVKSGAAATIADQQVKLASTPMTFNYYGKGGIPGFGHENPVRSAFALFIASAVTMITVVLQGMAALLPWLLLLALLVAAVRSRWGRQLVRAILPSREADKG